MYLRTALLSFSIGLLGGCQMSGMDGHRCGGNGMCGGNVGSGTTAGTPPACTSDAQCDKDSYCDTSQGRCEPGTPCKRESDCGGGFNCDLARAICTPAPEPTCGELATEAECVGRPDCTPVYAGIDCSCGANCTCAGGEPGCICQSFEFFRCTDAKR